MTSDERRPPSGGMLRLARIARGLSQEELSSSTGILQGRLSKLENGTIPVAHDDLSALSNALSFPPSFFSLRIEEHGAVSEVFHRKRFSSSARLVKSITASLSIQSFRISKLLESVEIRAPRALRTMDPDDVGGDIKAIARELRRVWGVPPGPIRDLTTLVESAGVVIFRTPLQSDKLSGVSQWLDSSAPIMFINESMPTDRYRWTIAHELGHLVMHAGTYSFSDDIEAEADTFASEFLVPDADVEDSMRSQLSFDRLAAMKLHWRVSMASLIMKAGDIGAITPARKLQLMKAMSARGWRKSEPAALTPEHPGLANRLFQAFLGIPDHTLNDACTSLGIVPSELNVWFRDSQQDGLRRLP